mgnify:CR=1 FL=1
MNWSQVLDIKFYNRQTQKIETEKVYGDAQVRWLYQTPTGQFLLIFLVKAFISKIYGAYQNWSISKAKIEPFIQDFGIDLADFEPTPGRSKSDPYASFNEFFIRTFVPGKRTFVNEPKIMPAFSEARYFAYESMTDEQTVPVKGRHLSAKALLNRTRWNDTFNEGPLLLARLCPVDYHRFHYPDNGKVLDYYRVHGKLHSVNPVALKEFGDIFATNERQVTIIETENFGKLAYIEVGALCVGKIVQSGSLEEFKRGDEKGYFLFGGSTVIVLGEKGRWTPEPDMLEYTAKGIETYLQLGEPVARA